MAQKNCQIYVQWCTENNNEQNNLQHMIMQCGNVARILELISISDTAEQREKRVFMKNVYFDIIHSIFTHLGEPKILKFLKCNRTTFGCAIAWVLYLVESEYRINFAADSFAVALGTQFDMHIHAGKCVTDKIQSLHTLQYAHVICQVSIVQTINKILIYEVIGPFTELLSSPLLLHLEPIMNIYTAVDRFTKSVCSFNKKSIQNDTTISKFQKELFLHIWKIVHSSNSDDTPKHILVSRIYSILTDIIRHQNQDLLNVCHIQHSLLRLQEVDTTLRQMIDLSKTCLKYTHRMSLYHGFARRFAKQNTMLALDALAEKVISLTSVQMHILIQRAYSYCFIHNETCYSLCAYILGHLCNSYQTVWGSNDNVKLATISDSLQRIIMKYIKLKYISDSLERIIKTDGIIEIFVHPEHFASV